MLSVSPESVDVERAVESYRRHGFARLGKVISDQALGDLRARADEIMLGQVVHEGLFFQHDSETGAYEDLSYGQGYVGPSLAYRKLEKLEKDARFLALIENPLFERVVKQVIAGPSVIYRATLFNKAKARNSPLPWHQDGGSYWGLSREPELQIWTALDDASEESGCVDVIPGSHAAGLATPLGGVIPRDVLARARAEERAVRVPARAGEVLLLHNHLWHRSQSNQSGRARRAFTVCYMSAAVQCLRKKRAPRTFFSVFGGR